MSAGTEESIPARYPEVAECNWYKTGRCERATCRYSVLTEFPSYSRWEEQDRLELLQALASICALDYAGLGGLMLDEVATYLGMSRSHVEQTEFGALRKLMKVRDLRKVFWDSR